MEAFAAALVLIAGAIWVGAIVFQSAIVAPAVFANLDESAARQFLRGLFPRFFRFGLYCGVAMSVGVLWIAMASSWSMTLVGLAGTTVMMLVLEYASLRMVPGINEARDAGASGEARFHRLHRLSVLLTVVIMFLGLSLLGVFGFLASTAFGA